MTRDRLRRLIFGVALPLAVGATAAGTAAPALAWNAHQHTYSFSVTNATGQCVDDAKVSVFGWSPPGVPVFCPFISAGSTTFWPYTFTTPIGPGPVYPPIWQVVRFVSPGPARPCIPNGQSRWFCVTVNVPSASPSTMTTGWFHWTLGGVPIGPNTALGWQIHSPPALVNPVTDPDGAANTHNLIVRNLKFAKSPYAIATDSLTGDNATVLARFTESVDVVRAGPLTVSPGDTLAISALPPSIPEPVRGGSTVLGRGTVEDHNGVQQDFVMQFANPAPLPGASRLGLIVLALLLATIGTLILWRSRALRPSAP